MTNSTSVNVEEQLAILQTNVDQLFLVICGIFVLFMQAGFAFLEAGSVRSKNTTNIIMKNVLDLFIGAICYWSVGYSFAYGEPGNPFIGHNQFFASNVQSPVNGTEVAGTMTPEAYYGTWFFQYVFTATASTIVSGAMAERTEFVTYMVYCFFLTAFVYPVVSHWCWAPVGWLASGSGTGLSFKDFAGSGVVHITGGSAALVGAAILGPRIGRFNADGSAKDLPGHTVTVAALGGFILFVGFMAFNGGSQLSISNAGDGVAVAVSVMNTVIGGSAGAISAMIAYKMTDAIRRQDHYWSLIITINGGLAGMVSMCASCNDLYPWSAAVIGCVAGLSFIGWHHLMLNLKIDDPLDAVAVHLGGGLTGVLMGPIFAINGLVVDGVPVGGIIFGAHGMAFKNFAWNLLGAVAIIVWTAGTCSILFGIMRYLGVLRVSRRVELAGLDTIKHGEPAYPLEGYFIGEHPHYEVKNGDSKNVIKNDQVEHESDIIQSITDGELAIKM